MVVNETDRIIESSKCDYLDDLLNSSIYHIQKFLCL